MKLEDTINEAVFLAPKLYAYINSSGQFISKVKGMQQLPPKSTLAGSAAIESDQYISFHDFKDLLVRNSKLEKWHEKWYKSITIGKINVKKQLYTLKVTDNKRSLIYSALPVGDMLVGTKSYKINYDKIINDSNSRTDVD